MVNLKDEDAEREENRHEDRKEDKHDDKHEDKHEDKYERDERILKRRKEQIRRGKVTEEYEEYIRIIAR